MKEIIQEAYALFGAYKAILPLDVCTDCCMDPGDAALLASLPVHEIPHDLLMEYNDEASTGKTPAAEIKHFLPRYLELIATFEFPSHSAELSLERLNPTLEEEWSAVELDFLTRFTTAFWKTCLAAYPLPAYESIDAILVMVWRSGLEVTDLLDQWQEENTLSSVLHFWDLYVEGFEGKRSLKLKNAFAEADISEQLKDWVSQNETKTAFRMHVEKLILNDTSTIDEEQSDQLSQLYDMLSYAFA